MHPLEVSPGSIRKGRICSEGFYICVHAMYFEVCLHMFCIGMYVSRQFYCSLFMLCIVFVLGSCCVRAFSRHSHDARVSYANVCSSVCMLSVFFCAHGVAIWCLLLVPCWFLVVVVLRALAGVHEFGSSAKLVLVQ